MTTVYYTAKARDSRTLELPEEAAELELQPGEEVQVSVNRTGSRKSLTLSEAVARLTNRSPEQIAQAQAQAIEAYKPLRTVPPGKTLADVVSGQWPGKETDDQINQALEELS